MSAFKDDHAENLKNVEYAYEYGRSERELEIIKLLEAKADQAMRAGQGKPLPERMEYLAVETSIRQVIALIKGENND